MTLNEACNLIEEYRVAKGHKFYLDAAKAMVADHYYLSHTEQEAIDMFMDAGRKMFAPIGA
jgi:hypothetical protein